MANPDNALGTNGAYGGRTSVNAFNDVLATFESRGILSGWGCIPGSGMTVNLGGNSTDRDVALAEDNSGNKTTINNISQAPVPITLPAAPSAGKRIDAIVSYVESPPSTNAETDNYSAVNLLAVSGIAASTPSAPDDSRIRTAITADGTSGATAYYVVLALVTLPSGTTDIDATMITAGQAAQISNEQVGDESITSDKIDFSTMKKWMPDYSNQVSLGRITEYTATEDGWICASYYGYNTNGIYTAIIKVNNKTVWTDSTEATAPNGTRASRGTIMIPLCKRDTITGLSGVAEDSYFIPGKWV